MADGTVIGQGAKVRGRVTGDGDLEVLGHVEGAIEVTGDVTVGDGGLVGSDVHGRRVVVRGAIKGNLIGDEAVVLENGARVVGDLRAPRVAIAEGALVRGHVSTGGARAAAPRAAAKPAAREVPKARVAPPPPPKAAPPKEAPKPAARKAPPPPVVPALKKGAKGALKKRASGG